MPALSWTDRLGDWRLAAAAAAVTGMGMIAMASAAANLNPALAARHGAYALIGLAAGWGVSRTAYRRWSDAAVVFYVLAVAGLVLVEVAGATRLGATRWLSVFGLSLQPSELAKFALILLLAHRLAGQPRPLPDRAVWTSLAVAAAPALLVFQQPDLGSASVLGAIWLGMAWAAGVRRGLLVRFGLAALAAAPVGWHVLKSYQRDRLAAFINPHADPLGAGYTIIQSTIAIGSGRWTGRGWFAGTQNQLSFLPERHSDFIFSVIGEEWGLLGCLTLLAAFAWLLLRLLRIAQECPEPHGRLLAAGVAAWLGYQAFVNMGMVMGLLPVVGVPLPLVSFGGSSMVTVWVALGLALSVHRGHK
jgi:rod shape determining protein RodA